MNCNEKEIENADVKILIKKLISGYFIVVFVPISCASMDTFD